LSSEIVHLTLKFVTVLPRKTWKNNYIDSS